jgi:hypothetical protein
MLKCQYLHGLSSYKLSHHYPQLFINYYHKNESQRKISEPPYTVTSHSIKITPNRVQYFSDCYHTLFQHLKLSADTNNPSPFRTHLRCICDYIPECGFG